MENHEYSVGLDIGTTKIVAIVGRRNAHGKIEVLGVGKAKSLGVHKGIVNNISQTIQSIKSAVAEAQSSSGVPIHKVTVGIAGKHIRSLQHSDYIMRENPDKYITEKKKKKLSNISVRDQARHSSLAVTDVYTRHRDNADKAILDLDGTL